MNDKPQTQMVYTRITRELHRALQEQARVDRRTLAATMALALEEFIERHAPRDGREKASTVREQVETGQTRPPVFSEGE